MKCNNENNGIIVSALIWREERKRKEAGWQCQLKKLKANGGGNVNEREAALGALAVAQCVSSMASACVMANHGNIYQ